MNGDAKSTFKDRWGTIHVVGMQPLTTFVVINNQHLIKIWDNE